MPAKPAAARVVHSSQLYGPDFAVDAGSVFVQTGNAIRGVNLRTGARTTPYRVPDGYRQYAMDARGGRLAVGIDAAVEPGGPLPRVDSVPEAGGPATVVADSTATDDCYRTVRLAGVTESGETVTDEMDCNAPLVDYPGTLFAYAPDGDRRVFGTRKVPDPYVLYDESEIRLRGERYVLLVPDPRGPGQGRVFVAGRAGARRLVKTWLIDSIDLDSRGAAVVSYTPRGKPRRGGSVVKLFGPGQPGRIVMDAAPGWVVARFCGTRLVVLESRPHQVRMTVRDRPLGKPRVLVARRTKRAQAPAVECDAHDVVYDTREGRPERTVLHAVSLRQPGEPAQPGP